VQFLRSLTNIALGATGGILGNLLAGWIQQDTWGNTFTPPRVVGTLAGFVLVIMLLAWIDASATRRQRSTRTPTGIRENVQIGNPVIRVLRGTNVYRNLQIGPGRIEVIDDSPETQHDPP